MRRLILFTGAILFGGLASAQVASYGQKPAQIFEFDHPVQNGKRFLALSSTEVGKYCSDVYAQLIEFRADAICKYFHYDGTSLDGALYLREKGLERISSDSENKDAYVVDAGKLRNYTGFDEAGLPVDTGCAFKDFTALATAPFLDDSPKAFSRLSCYKN